MTCNKHPWYGECDALGKDDSCVECAKMGIYIEDCEYAAIRTLITIAEQAIDRGEKIKKNTHKILKVTDKRITNLAAIDALESYRWHRLNRTISEEIFEQLEKTIRDALKIAGAVEELAEALRFIALQSSCQRCAVKASEALAAWEKTNDK